MADQGYATPLEFTDFSGGITDNYIDGKLNTYKEADNLLVKDDKKFRNRFGTQIYNTHSTMDQIPAGQTRVAAQFLFDGVYFYNNARNIYYQSSTTAWGTLQGTSSNAAMAAGTASTYLSWAEWNKHLIVTSSAYGSPMKIYNDSAGTTRVRNAGLPKITLVGCIELANQIKSKYNAHAASGTLHAHADSTNLTTSTDAHDLASLIVLTTELIADFTAHNADANLAAAWLYHGAQQVGAPAHTLASTTTPETLADCKTILDDIKTKYNAHDADATAHTSGATQVVAKVSAPSLASAGGTTHNYIYTFLAHFTYTVGGSTFQDFGPTYQVAITNIGTPNTNTVTIANIPTIANSTFENYDTATIQWYIYRTEDAGTTSYYLKAVTNGTTSTTDTATDASINTGVQIYTAGGVLDNDPPPQAKYVIQANDIVWYLNCKEGNSTRKFRVRQSVKFDGDSCPESFFIDMDDDITGGGVVGIYPIIFCNKRIYRLEGFQDDQGNGAVQKFEISRTAGCINHLSIVNTLEGIFFAGQDGWYFTDGFSVTPIATQLRSRYLDLVSTQTQRDRMYGVFDIHKNLVYWACMASSSSDDNDVLYVLHLNFGVSRESTFTTVSPDADSWRASSIGFDASDVMQVGDSRGYVLAFDENYFSDVKVNVAVASSTWTTKAIIYDYQGPALSFGTVNAKKLASWITATFGNETNMSVTIGSKNDDSGTWHNLNEIRFRDNITWRDVDAPTWSHTFIGAAWRYFPMINEKRRFPSQNLRSMYKQIQFTNSLTVIARSDDLSSTAAVVKAAHTATISSGSWPTEAVDHYISFASDNYTLNYLITARSSTVLTFTDTAVVVTDAAASKWVIRGYRRNERLNLVAFSLAWMPMTSSLKTYRGDDGANA